MDFLTRLFDTSGFPARWHCGSAWEESPWLGWLHILSDIGIWSAYLAIPCVLAFFLFRRKNLPFRTIFLLFGAFIFACGMNHLMEAAIFWWPAYRLSGVIKLVTALVSWATVVALVSVVPKVLTLRSSQELEREIAARKIAEAALQQANEDLESRIRERTTDLVNSNSALHREREWFQTTLSSIGDAVIATDAEGRVTFLNSVAQQLTGWTADQASGQFLPDVFRIVNETSRQPVENPAVRALKEGVIVGLANHTILIGKDATERPIDDSAAPIRDENGKTIGAVLIFRDIGERKKAEDALRASEARKAAILRASLDAIVTIDGDGRVVGFNPAAEALFGYSESEALHKDMGELIVPVDLRENHRQGMARYNLTGEAPILNRRLELPAHRRDGTKLTVELVITRLEGDRLLFTGFIRDITARKVAEFALAERVRFLALSSEVGTALIQGDSLKAILQRCAGAIVKHLDGAFARIWTHNSKENLLEMQASAGLYTHIDGHHGRVPVGQFKIGQIAQERKPHLTNSVIGDSRVPEQEWAAREGITSFAGYPLVIDDRLVGVVAMFARHPLSPHTLDAIKAVANEIALGIEQKRAEEEVARLLALEQSRSYRLRQVAAASLTINSATTSSSVVGVIRAEAKRIIGALHSDVYLQAETVPFSSAGLTAPLVGRGGRAWGRICLTGKDAGPFTDDDGAILIQLAHMAAVAFDNARLYEELREGDRRKDEFLATLAHELRNPLAPIRNSLQVMRLAGHNQAVVEGSRAMMERQVQQMVRLVDDLLDLSRISRGKMHLQKAQVDLAVILHGALETSQPLIEAGGHELFVALPSEPVLLNADATRLAQVFLNLLNNAAKYTERGGRIWLNAERQGESIRVSVRDSGMGIPAEMLPHIFEMFTQVERSIERSQGGLGIGLTLVRRLVEMHGGTVEALSAGSGLGSEFVVRLPIFTEVETSNAPHDGTDLEKTARRRPKRRILVVDDNRDSADSLAVLLKLMGDEVRTAYDGLEGIDVATEFQPGLILLDLGLPRLNGYDVCRRLREQPWGRKVIVVALTGWGQEDDRRRSKEAGFDYHLVKPVDPAGLETLLLEAPMERTSVS